MQIDHTVQCETCELEVPWPALEHDGRFYCCWGCAAGGPCYCSYDLPPQPPRLEELEDFVTALSTPRSEMNDRIPLTEDVYARLRADFEQVELALAALRDKVSRDADDDQRQIFATETAWEQQQLARRRDLLDGVLARAQVVPADGTVVVGTRVRVRDADNIDEEYVLVAPGEADPRARRISIDSPLGQALLGRREGETTEVGAPDGKRAVTVLEVQ